MGIVGKCVVPWGMIGDIMVKGKSVSGIMLWGRMGDTGIMGKCGWYGYCGEVFGTMGKDWRYHGER